jgi:hypothetical protein
MMRGTSAAARLDRLTLCAAMGFDEAELQMSRFVTLRA